MTIASLMHRSCSWKPLLSACPPGSRLRRRMIRPTASTNWWVARASPRQARARRGGMRAHACWHASSTRCLTRVDQQAQLVFDQLTPALQDQWMSLCHVQSNNNNTSRKTPGSVLLSNAFTKNGHCFMYARACRLNHSCEPNTCVELLGIVRSSLRMQQACMHARGRTRTSVHVRGRGRSRAHDCVRQRLHFRFVFTQSAATRRRQHAAKRTQEA